MDLFVRSIPVVALLSACPACVLGPEPVFARNVREGGAYCASRQPPSAERSRASVELAALPTPAAEARGYSARALATARAIGASAEIERLAEAEARGSAVIERGELNDVIAFAALDVASTVANIECEEGRASQVASDLRDAEEKQTQRLTAYSLVLTAAASIAAGVLAIGDKNQTPASVVGIGGGLTGGTLGFATLAVHRSTTFRHARNILAEVWQGSAHPDFPKTVWAYLTSPELIEHRDRTRRDYLVQTWKESGKLGDDPAHPSPERVALYFGEGGTYDAAGLEDRAEMLSDVRETVNLMSHDLRDLASETAHAPSRSILEFAPLRERCAEHGCDPDEVAIRVVMVRIGPRGQEE